MKTKQKLLIAIMIVLGIFLVIFFGLRAFRPFRELHGHRPPRGEIETDVSLIREWMTIPYIAKRYYVPGDKLFEAVKIPPRENKYKSLLQLNNEYYPDQPGFVLETIQADILAHQPPTPPGNPPPSPTPGP